MGEVNHRYIIIAVPDSTYRKVVIIRKKFRCNPKTGIIFDECHPYPEDVAPTILS